MKSRVALVATASALLLAVSGCSSSAGGSGDALEFQTQVSVDSKLMAALQEVTAKFEKANPDVTVDLVPAGTNYESDMKVRLAAGNVPDILATHGWSLLRYSEFLEPLQDEPWAADFNPDLASAMKNADGEFFAFPVDTDVAGILYNGDVLDSAGIDPASIATWSDFEDAADAVKADGAIPITVSGKDNAPAGNVADWIAPGGYDEGQLDELTAGTFVDEPYTDMLSMVDDWREAGYFNPDYSSATADDMARALADDRTAFVFSQNATANNALQYNPEANLGFIPVPSLTGGSPYLIGGEMNAYGISKSSEHLDDAKAFLAFLAQAENATMLAGAAGNLPGLTNATADLGALQSSFDSFMTSGDVPLVPYFDRVYLPNGMWNTMVTTTDSIITGQTGVDRAVDQMRSDFTSLEAQGN
jgi:raffinose/stachyose/melibiose transport system substrate-binding protein